MSNKSEKSRRQFVIGRERFRQISAVEGLQLSFAAGREFDEDEERGLTPAERRKRIVSKYVRDRS